MSKSGEEYGAALRPSIFDGGFGYALIHDINTQSLIKRRTAPLINFFDELQQRANLWDTKKPGE